MAASSAGLNRLAVPKTGECQICFLQVPSVKVLPCKHRFCEACIRSIVSSAGNTCPNCRAAFDAGKIAHLPTHYFGKLSCDYCLVMKSVDDFWFCRTCLKSFCSKCSIKEHKLPDHQSVEWDIGIVHHDCEALILGPYHQFYQNDVFEFNKQQVEKLCTSVLPELVAKKVYTKSVAELLQAQRFLDDKFGYCSHSSLVDYPSIDLKSDAPSNVLKKLVQLCGSPTGTLGSLQDWQVHAIDAELLPLEFLASSLETHLVLKSYPPENIASPSPINGETEKKTKSSQNKVKGAQGCSSPLPLAASSSYTPSSPGVHHLLTDSSRYTSSSAGVLPTGVTRETRVTSRYTVVNNETVPQLLFMQSGFFICVTSENIQLFKINASSEEISPVSSLHIDSIIDNANEGRVFLASAFCAQKDMLYVLTTSSGYRGCIIDCYMLDVESDEEGDEVDDSRIFKFQCECAELEISSIGSASVAVTSTNAVYFVLNRDDPNDGSKEEAELWKLSNKNNYGYSTVSLLHKQNTSFLYLVAKYERSKIHLLSFLDGDAIFIYSFVAGPRHKVVFQRQIPLDYDVVGMDYLGSKLLIQSPTFILFAELKMDGSEAVEKVAISSAERGEKFGFSDVGLISLGFEDFTRGIRIKFCDC